MVKQHHSNNIIPTSPVYVINIMLLVWLLLHLNAVCHLRQFLAHLFWSGELGLPIQLLLTGLHYTLQPKADNTQGNFWSIFVMQTLTKKLPP